MTDIKDLDNIIYRYIREIRPINITKINNDIKKIKIKNKFMNLNNRLILYAYKSHKNYTSYSVLLINCCNKCGNFNSVKVKTNRILCKCKLTIKTKKTSTF